MTQQCAGAILISKKTGRILMLKRSDENGVWAGVGGGIEGDESPEEAVKRETQEETGYTGQMKLYPSFIFDHPKICYRNYFGIVPDEFSVSLNGEHTDSAWLSFSEFFNIRKEWHFGIKLFIQREHKMFERILHYCFMSPNKKKS